MSEARDTGELPEGRTMRDPVRFVRASSVPDTEETTGPIGPGTPHARMEATWEWMHERIGWSPENVPTEIRFRDAYDAALARCAALEEAGNAMARYVGEHACDGCNKRAAAWRRVLGEGTRVIEVRRACGNPLAMMDACPAQRPCQTDSTKVGRAPAADCPLARGSDA